MALMPLPFLLGFLAGLLSLAGLLGGLYIAASLWMGGLQGGWWATAAGVLAAWALLGRWFVLAFYAVGETESFRTGGEPGTHVPGPDGSRLYVEMDGPETGPVVLLTHGWALNSTAWRGVRKRLAKAHRLILWDLPGLGRSTPPRDGRYTVERLAEDLKAVLSLAQGRPVTLVGHSIGGMMILTLCRRFPELMGQEVAGIVLVDTTHRWPLRTVTASRLLRLLRWPVIEPLLWLTILLAPLVWAMNWLSYLNGTSHIVNRLTSLGEHVTRSQLDFAARFNAIDNPAVVAKGLLAVLRWDEAETPASVRVPVRVISGDEDRLTLPQASHELADILPDADLVRIDQAGHNGLIERGRAYAEAIAQAVQRFVRQTHAV